MGSFLNLMVKLGLNASGYQLGMKRAESQAKAFSKVIKEEFEKAFGAAAIFEFSRRIVESADNLVDLSDQLGVSTKELQEWQYAAKKTGASAEDVTKFFEAIATSRKNAIDGNEDAIAAYQRLGLSVLRISQLRVPDIAKKTGEAFKSGDPQTLMPFLKEIGGKSASRLIPAFKEGLDGLFDGARKSGQVWSDETILHLKQVKTELEHLADTFRGPVATAIVYAAKIATLFGDALQSSVGGAAAFWGGFTAGINPAQDMTKWDYKKALRDGVDAMDAAQNEIKNRIAERKKEFQDTVKERQGPPLPPGFDIGYGYRKPDRMLNLGMRVIGETSRPEGLTEWQRLGAAVRQDATTPILKSIETNTERAADRLEAMRQLNVSTANSGGGGFGGGF